MLGLHWFPMGDTMPRPRICLAPLLIGIAAVATSASLAQSLPPAPSSVSAAPAQAPGGITTLKAGTQLVIVDVVVTDSRQNPIHNLKASDFTLIENGSPQRVANFEEHAALPPEQAAKIAPMRPLPPGFFTNFTPAPPGSAVNVLLLDQLNTTVKDQAYVMGQLREFLKNAPVGTRIAIFMLNDRLTMLQGFTSDLTVLKAVMARPNLGSSILLTDSSGHYDNVGNGGTAAPSEVLSGIAGTDIAQLISNLQQSEAWQASQDTQNRAKQTLDAMNELAHYLSGIPGRKNLIWFSGSFPITIFPGEGIAHPFDVVGSSEEEFRETTRILAQAQVAVYPIDARGIKTLGPPIAVSGGPASSGTGLTMAMNKAYEDNVSDHLTMYQMAADTGGHAYVDTNGLSEAAGKAIEAGSNYYTLSYTPANSKQDGKYRKIQVKVAQPGLTLSYRNGYYADEPEGTHKADTEYSASKTPNTMTRAMMRGAPPATEILMKLQVLPARDGQEASVAPGNELRTIPGTKAKVKGPFRRYAIDIAADARDIHITKTPDGHYQFSTEVLTFVYDANGNIVNAAVQHARGNLSVSAYANMLHVGLPFHEEISVPAGGEYYLRTSVHDTETDRIGAVEIPVASVAHLAPLAASSAAATPVPGAAPR
jgi:VWFA-related protein